MQNTWIHSVLLVGILVGLPALATAQDGEAHCDFDGDGLTELAIGVPGDNDGVGAVYVIDYQGDLLLYDVQWFRPGQNVDSFGAADGTHFGAALACGDFDGDGYADLAVGSPGTVHNQGNVAILYGSSGGLADPPWDGRLYQDMADLNETMEDDDYFGAALAAGDFDGDGVDDLAIGVPGESEPGGVAPGWVMQGLVHVLYGRTEENASPNYPPGPSPLGSQQYHPNLPAISIVGNAHYGRSLAAADLNGDDVEDLAVGAPYAWVNLSPNPLTVDIKQRAGVVHTMLGVAGDPALGGGLDLNTSLILSQRIAPDEPATDELFGYSLATGNFDGADGYELAVGVPLEKLGDGFAEVGSGYGAVNLFQFDALGAVAHTELWFETVNMGDGFENRDFFGFSLAVGDFDASGEDDLAIGRKGEGFRFLGETKYAGMVTVLYGSGAGLLEMTNDARDFSPFSAPDSRQEFGFVLATGNFLIPDEVDLAVGVPGWTGRDRKGDPVNNAGAVVVFRGIEGDGISFGSPTGLLSKDQIEEDPNRASENNLDKLFLPADSLVQGTWVGERFGAAFAH